MYVCVGPISRLAIVIRYLCICIANSSDTQQLAMAGAVRMVYDVYCTGIMCNYRTRIIKVLVRGTGSCTIISYLCPCIAKSSELCLHGVCL